MTNTHTKTNTKTITNTKCLKDPSHAIFSKSREFKDIRYDAYNDKDNDKEKNQKCWKGTTYAIFLKTRGYKDIRYDILTTQLFVPFALIDIFTAFAPNGVQCVQGPGQTDIFLSYWRIFLASSHITDCSKEKYLLSTNATDHIHHPP